MTDRKKIVESLRASAAGALGNGEGSNTLALLRTSERLLLVVVAALTVLAAATELIAIATDGRISLADLLLMFPYTEVVGMLAVSSKMLKGGSTFQHLALSRQPADAGDLPDLHRDDRRRPPSGAAEQGHAAGKDPVRGRRDRPAGDRRDRPARGRHRLGRETGLTPGGPVRAEPENQTDRLGGKIRNGGRARD
ncbi:hypothetical protein [Rhodovibrio sodomensis]|uniref:hypothetical protein n=1 Tax=Rhodovibrio sodomensis TaxID=1088 RepID=UPI001F5B445D|nr:hypothetical protein [Rhodovibrio sodomensis]